MVAIPRFDDHAFGNIKVAAHCLNPYPPLGIEPQLEDGTFRQPVLHAEVAELVAIEAADAIVGGCPNVAVVVLQ